MGGDEVVGKRVEKGVGEVMSLCLGSVSGPWKGRCLGTGESTFQGYAEAGDRMLCALLALLFVLVFRAVAHCPRKSERVTAKQGFPAMSLPSVSRYPTSPLPS